MKEKTQNKWSRLSSLQELPRKKSSQPELLNRPQSITPTFSTSHRK